MKGDTTILNPTYVVFGHLYLLVCLNYRIHDTLQSTYMFVTSSLREHLQSMLAFFGIFWPHTYPCLHFYCSTQLYFLTTYPPLNANVICESSLIENLGASGIKCLKLHKLMKIRAHREGMYWAAMSSIYIQQENYILWPKRPHTENNKMTNSLLYS